MSQRIVVRGPALDAIDVIDEPAPSAGRGQVRIQVKAAGVAFGDVFRRKVSRRPYTPGYDVVGDVDAVGQGVDSGWVGKRVACFMPKPGHGGYAEHVVVGEEHAVAVPSDLDPVRGVCLGLNYITAYQLLTRITTPRPGQAILIHGAAGGVGTAVLDLARLLEIKAYGTASASKHEWVQRYGGIPIDYRSTDFVAELSRLEPSGVACVYDPIGGSHLARSLQCLERGGTLVAFGASGALEQGASAILTSQLRLLALKLKPSGKHVRLYNITLNRGAKLEDCRRDWSTLIQLYGEGKLDPVVGAVLPLARAREAHEMLEQRAVTGKIVLVPGA
ncbi:MAG TPA: zinc-binding dehydrogenase [Polyangiaceae bacterium]|nr:zinc-binding dehydrogenase [Polyangiaceae bacterium]